MAFVLAKNDKVTLKMGQGKFFWCGNEEMAILLDSIYLWNFKFSTSEVRNFLRLIISWCFYDYQPNALKKSD